jgi:hypothetical protein
MSRMRQMTSIHLPTCPDPLPRSRGIAEAGEQTVARMLERYRNYAAHQVAVYQAVLDAPDEAFQIEAYDGVYRRKNVEVLQEADPQRLLRNDGHPHETRRVETVPTKV